MSATENDQGGLRRAAAYLEARSQRRQSHVAEPPAVEGISVLLESFDDEVRTEVLEYLRAAVAAKAVTSVVAGEPTKVLDPDSLLEHARLEGEVRRQIFEEPLFDADAVAQLLGSETSNRQRAAKLRRQGKLVGVKHGARYLFPAFQFDRERGRIHEAAEQANQRLGAAADPWGVASWWIRPRDVLGGEAPKALLGTPRESLIGELAEADLQPLG